MEGRELRKADVVTSVIVFLLGVFILIGAFRMPMKDSWGGVNNVWFVSPALFPLMIGTALILLSLALFAFALRQLEVGLKEAFRPEQKAGIVDRLLSGKNIKFIAILTMFISFIYLYIPRVDFFLSMWLFLAGFITMFYYERLDLLKKLYLFYLLGTVVFLLVFLFGLDKTLAKIYYFAVDILAIIFIFAYMIYARMVTKGDPGLRARFRASMAVAFVTPLFIIPVFKYLLMVVLPQEGMIIEFMNTIRYVWLK